MRKIILSTFIFFSSILYSISYDVEFIGLKDKTILKKLKEISIFSDREIPRGGINSLRYKAKENIPEILEIFKSYGYFDATISFDVEREKKGTVLYIFLDPGVRYKVRYYKIETIPEGKGDKIDLEKLGIYIGSPTTSKDLLDAKDKILSYFSQISYPLASIKKYDIIADYRTKTISVDTLVDLGPFASFGETFIAGLKTVKSRYIYRKITWEEGKPFSPKDVRETQKRLTGTNLFSSVIIKHPPSINEEGLLPMEIYLSEAKHQNISFGANYATVDGFGYTVGWSHHNLRGMGEVLSLQADISKRAYLGSITYKKPDFIFYDQALVTRAFATREKIRAYLAYTYGILGRLDHKISPRLKYSYGVLGEYIEVTHSANNNKFDLIGLPFYVRYNTSGSILDPTEGFGITYFLSPYAKMQKRRHLFLKQKIVGELYIPTKKNKKIVLAFRLQLGSIVGASLYKIPMTKLYLGGSNEDLRGYRYKTVSPRDQNGKIIGGKSVIYLTFEPRLRISKRIGIVPFLDLGNVRRGSFPSLHGKWRKSVGVGLRYFSFFGPLRFDVGFPLDKYKRKDPSYRIYVSIGQTF